MLEAVDLMLWWLVYTVAGGTCLVIGSVFLSLAVMIVRSGWEAASPRVDAPGSRDTGSALRPPGPGQGGGHV